MPSIERIEQFHQTLAQLGDEPSIAADRGEIIEAPAPPEENLDDDLSALLGDFEAESEQIAQSQAAAPPAEAEDSSEGEDTSALLSNLDDLFSEDEESGEEAPQEESEDPFASIDLGDDDFPAPPDFSFDPDAIPDEIPEDELAAALGEGAEEEPGGAEDEFAGADEDAFGDIDELGDIDEPAEGDLVAEEPSEELSADTDEPEEVGETDDLGDEGDLDDLDELGDLDELDEEDLASQEPPAAESAEQPTDELFADTDEPEEVGETDDLGDLDDLEDLGDLDDLDELGDPGDDDAFAGIDDIGEAEMPAAGEDVEESTDEGADEDETFDDDFGSQLDSEFGDDLLGDDDALELPSVDDDLEKLEDEGFSLGDFGEEFDIDEESIDEFAGLDVDAEEIEDAEGDLSAAPDQGLPSDRELSDKEFAHLQATLNSLPLNVKIAVEETIGEPKGSAEQIDKLIDVLIAGAAPVAIAETVSTITGDRLQVPKGYQKRSGLAFEEEKQSLRYRFVHVVLPVLRVAVLVIAAVSLLGFLSYRFVYRPIHAAILYRQGYTHAVEDRYQQANDTFERAWNLWERPPWFSRYAEVYVEKRQYELAVEKYDQLVFGMDPDDRAFLRGMVAQGLLVEPVRVDTRGRPTTVYDLLYVDRQGILDHGRLQSETLANYERADQLYSILLYEDEFDYDGLMARGDNFLRWAEEGSIRPDDGRSPEEAAAGRYEQARRAYARLLEGHGDTDPILMRFLRFFVRTDNFQRVEELVNVFERGSPDARVHPEIYAETAGYLLDKGVRSDVRNMLIRSYEIAPEVPQIHYHLARYNRAMQAVTEERTALDNARVAFEAAEPLSRRQLRMQIDTDILSAEYWYHRDELIRTIEDTDRALDRYEEARDMGLLEADQRLARLYAIRGDIEYYAAGNLPRALSLYNRAVEEGYVTEEINFKRGYINYALERFDEAIEHFYTIGSSNALDGPENLIYARANTLFRRGNYVGAEAMYRRLRRTLEARRDRITNLLVDEDPAHRGLMEYLYKVNNNLGVTLYRQTEMDTTRPERFSEGLAALQVSAELAENYQRDDETGRRSLARNLAYLNIQGILNPTAEFQPQIYRTIPRDMDQVLF